MTTPLNAPADPVLIQCRRCGRPLSSPISRVLRIGSRCRHGVPEQELLAVLTGASA